MKKLYALFLTFFALVAVSAQLVITNVSQGVVKMTYGQANDYSLYSPGVGTPSFWAHLWIPGTTYTDAWSNSNVEMVWNPAISAYEATVNFNTKVWTGNTAPNDVLPANTTVSNFGIVFKNQQNGATMQSADIMANSKGFTGTTTLGTMSVSDLNNLKGKSFVAEGALYTSKKGNLNVSVYDFSGRTVKTINVKADGNPIDLNISQKGMYILRVSNGTENEVVKFIK